MSEDEQRLLGRMEAQIESLVRRMARIEAGMITIGAGALSALAVIVLRNAGIL